MSILGPLVGFIAVFMAFGVVVVIPCIFIGRWLADRDIKRRKRIGPPPEAVLGDFAASKSLPRQKGPIVYRRGA